MIIKRNNEIIAELHYGPIFVGPCINENDNDPHLCIITEHSNHLVISEPFRQSFTTFE